MRQTRKRTTGQVPETSTKRKKGSNDSDANSTGKSPLEEEDEDFYIGNSKHSSSKKKVKDENTLRDIKQDCVQSKSSSSTKPSSSKLSSSSSSTPSSLKTKQNSASKTDLTSKFGYKKKTKNSMSVKNSDDHIAENNNSQVTKNNNTRTSKVEGESASKVKQTTNGRLPIDNCGSDSFISMLDSSGFQKGKTELQLKVVRPTAPGSCNLVHQLQQMTLGCKSRLKKTVKAPIVEMYKDFRLSRVASPFDRRVTAIEWHPKLHNMVAVGSKGGDIMLWNTEKVEKEYRFIQGIGAAGSCQAMKFWPWDLDKVVSASINGTVTLHDFEGRTGDVLADTMDSYDHWYCSVDINPSRYMVAAGRNGGILHLMSSEGRKIFEYRLHKNKITHVEFSPREEWLLCTASTDQTVQFWDIRNIKDRKSALAVLKHDKPVNSAYFSQTDGCRLLTTDQKNEIRVYEAPDLRLHTTIQHPHRFFQHITPFKATWHPLVDLIICGRYPDKEFPGYQDREPRTLDMFDANTGKVVAKLYDPEVDGLCPLNKFNPKGDSLVSGMGFHIKLWERNQIFETSWTNKIASGVVRSLMNASNQRSRPRSSRDRGSENGDDDDLKKKKKRKTNTETKKETKTKTKTLKKP